MFKYYWLVLCLVAVNSAKLGKEEDWEKFREFTKTYVRDCAEQYNIGEAEFKTAQTENHIDTLNPCFLSCFLKKANIINKEGMFDMESKIKIVSNVLKKPEDIAYFYELENICGVEVNSKPVTDGPAGCERSKMLLTCELAYEINRDLIQGMGY